MKEPVRVNIYGDSLMRATVIDRRRRYHTTVDKLFAGLAQRFGLCFKSRAHFGSTVKKGSELLERDIEKGMDCQFALLEYGGNDCSFEWEQVAKYPQAKHRPITPVEDFCTLLEGMARRLREIRVTPVMMTLPPVDAERHLDFISGGGENKQSIISWLGDTQMIYRFHEMYSAAVMRVAETAKCILVDVRGRFLDRHDWRELVGYDGVHLSEKGYAIIYEAFADFLAQRRAGVQRLVYG